MRRSSRKQTHAEPEAQRLAKSKKYLDNILDLLKNDLPDVAKIDCGQFGRYLTTDVKIQVIEAFLKMGEINFARIFRYRHRLGADPPIKDHPAVRAAY